MKTHPIARALALALVAALAACSGPKELPKPETPKEVNALVAGLTSNDPETRAKTAATAYKAGVPAIAFIRSEALIPALPDQVLSVAHAYHSFTLEAIKPGNDPLRAQVAAGFLDVLDSDIPPALREALLRDLALVCNEPGSIGRLAKLLERPDSTDGARRALEAIDHADADRALIAALGSAIPPKRIDYVRSLGHKRVLAAVQPITALASDSNVALATAARTALSRIGDAQSRALLEAAFDPAQRSTCDDLLEFADRRAAQGDFTTAEALYAKLMSATFPHLRAASAVGLAKVASKVPVPVKEHIDSMIRMLADPDASVRLATEGALSTMRDTASLALLRTAYWQGEATLRPALLRLLVTVDPNPGELLKAGLTDPVVEVRAEALRIAANSAVPIDGVDFLDIAKNEQGVEREAALDACLDAIDRKLDDGSTKPALAMLERFAALDASRDQRRRATRQIIRANETSALEWIDQLAHDDAKDDVARARLNLAAGLAKFDQALAIREAENVYLTASSSSLRSSALDRLKRLGGDPSVLLQRAGYLADFSVIGPLPRAGESDFTEHPFGARIDLAATVAGKDGKEVRWRRVARTSFDGIVDLEKIFEDAGECSGYGYCEFVADEAGPAQLKVGSDDGCAIWLNGELVHTNRVERGMHLDEDTVNVTLAPGTNWLLIKVDQAGGGFAFAVRMVRNAKP